MENEIICNCEMCKKQSEELIWLTHHFGVCQECYDDLTPEEVTKIIENYG